MMPMIRAMVIFHFTSFTRRDASLVADGSVASNISIVSHGGIRMMPMIYAMVLLHDSAYSLNSL